MPCPVVITVFQDKSFEFIVKKPQQALYKEEVNLKKGSGQTGIADPVASISKEQLLKNNKEKDARLNITDPEAASKIITKELLDQ